MTGKSRGGLGRGLAALIPTGPVTTTVSDVLINGAPSADSPPPRREHASLSLVNGGQATQSPHRLRRGRPRRTDALHP
jgi:hypothetical protein